MKKKTIGIDEQDNMKPTAVAGTVQMQRMKWKMHHDNPCTFVHNSITRKFP